MAVELFVQLLLGDRLDCSSASITLRVIGFAYNDSHLKITTISPVFLLYMGSLFFKKNLTSVYCPFRKFISSVKFCMSYCIKPCIFQLQIIFRYIISICCCSIIVRTYLLYLAGHIFYFVSKSHPELTRRILSFLLVSVVI